MSNWEKPPTSESKRRAVIAATIGNMLEAYDFAVYGFFAIIISRLFFPAGNETVSLLLTVATFGVGFIMRPVGAIVIGSFADRRGRKPALTLTIMLMAISTAMIGFAPTYSDIGIFAPAIIVLARLIQGFSAGGEVGSATAFLVEHAPPGRRGIFGSMQQAGQAGALLIGSLFGTLITGSMAPDMLESWGWRLPFIFGILIGPVGMYIRSQTEEGAEYAKSKETAQGSPLMTALRTHRASVLTGFAITIPWTVCTYFFLVFMPTYAVRELGFVQHQAFIANSIGLALVLVLAPVFGALSDRVDRKLLIMGGVVAMAIAVYPVLSFLRESPTQTNLIVCQALFAVLIASFTGPAPAAMTEVCPPEIRSTGVSIAYSFAVTIFGGFAPFITTWLVSATGQAQAPAWYIVGTAILSLALLLTVNPPRNAINV